MRRWVGVSAAVFTIGLVFGCVKKNSEKGPAKVAETKSEDANKQRQHNDKTQADASEHLAKIKAKIKKKKNVEKNDLKRVVSLEKKLRDKRQNKTLVRANTQILAEAMKGHTSIYPFEGSYRVLVIPVQFTDFQFENPDFYDSQVGPSEAQSYLFGSGSDSLTSYYKHASMGRLTLDGEVTSVVTVDQSLAYYGEAVAGRRNDRNARRLVVDALQKLKAQQTDESWWNQFDRWDLSDYDNDKHYNEP